MIIQETTKMSEREKMAARNSNFCYLLNALYPVGSIYVSKDPTDPAELFGGSWKRIKERFIWAIGDNENPGDTGGEKTHTLTEAELPKLSGSILNFALQEQGQSVSTSGVFSTRASQEWATYGSNGKIQDSDIVDFSAGSGQAHNNMPPWEGFYIWERIESDVPMGGSAGMLLADQTYNPESANAQSGIAVAQAVDTCSPAIVITSGTGKALTVSDSSESVIKGLTAYGESSQDGTPTTDSPVEIVSVENPVISVYGKNLIPATEISQTVNGITFTSLGDGTITMNGTSTATASITIPFQSSLHSGTYTLSFNNSEALGNNNVYALVRDDLGSFENFILYANVQNATRTTTINQDKTNIMLIVLIGTTLNSFTIRPQLEVGSVATPYEPYIEPQTVTVPYTFAKSDTLTLKDGTVKVNISGEETDITATEAGQVLLKLYTNYPNTSVISDIDLDITYKADTKNYIDNKIAALTALTLEG